MKVRVSVITRSVVRVHVAELKTSRVSFGGRGWFFLGTAERCCKGIVAGLYRARDAKADGCLGWAPDFPLDAAESAIVDLVKGLPPADNAAVRERLGVGQCASLGPPACIHRRRLSSASQAALPCGSQLFWV